MRHKKNAFTLVELLIVIIVIVILSTMLMLAGGEARAAAKATKIVNGLTNLKMSVLTWYRNNIEKFDKDGNFHKSGDLTKDAQTLQQYFSTSEGQAEIRKNLTGNFEISYSSGGYGIISSTSNNSKPVWYVCYYLENNSERERIKPKLASKANLAKNKSDESVLMQGSSGNWKSYTDGDVIYMPVLVFNY